MRQAREYRVSPKELKKMQHIELEMLLETGYAGNMELPILWMEAPFWELSGTKGLYPGMMTLT